ncbi:unnamed protein product [Rotaria magnacalcarata]|uniref:NAD(P)(+)--arginine ADP-ribosyltransferase n=1 Tax=Rotaria magnacalcarata TaxID=392030 RepID=A0A816XHN8_9BILA|nr:unnamed protein product [Rotaria magnacalcarata]
MECMYRQLSATLRSEDRQQLIPYFSYLNLFLTGLWKLPDLKDVVWRGMKGIGNDQYPQGKKFVWWGFSSCTSSLDVLQKDTFLGEAGQRTPFNIQCFNGKNIRNHSQFLKDNELLLMPCSYFEVMGSIKQEAVPSAAAACVPPPAQKKAEGCGGNNCPKCGKCCDCHVFDRHNVLSYHATNAYGHIKRLTNDPRNIIYYYGDHNNILNNGGGGIDLANPHVIYGDCVGGHKICNCKYS